MLIELFALAWLTYSPLFLGVDGFEINEIPNTVSLVYEKHELNEYHIAFPLKLHAKCEDIASPLQEDEAVVTHDGIECYMFRLKEPMYKGKRVKGSAKHYFRNGNWYAVSDYDWKLMERKLKQKG